MRHALLVCAAAAAVVLPIHSTLAQATESSEPAPSTQPATRPVTPKPLTNNVQRGLKWLADRQLDNGGWDQGEESAHMRGANANQPLGGANVGDTAMACMALLRSGSTPTEGPYADHLHRGVMFIAKSIEAADTESLYITDVRNTRLQSKLGTYVDTFAAAMLLAEVQNTMKTPEDNARVLAALDKTMRKIQRNQQENGAFANAGWAPALAQGMAAKAINRSELNGYDVDAEMKRRVNDYAMANFRDGQVVAEGSAGVELYARSSNLQSMKDALDNAAIREAELLQIVTAPATQPADVRKAQDELRQIGAAREQYQAAQQATVQRLGDDGFIAGFGSNGGEEFLSYMNIGEAMVAAGGPEWEKWDAQMTRNLNNIQNDDGSWSGHHCITGKTFCTASALLTLMVDRTPQGAKAINLKR